VAITVVASSTAGGAISSYDIYANGSKVGSGGTSQNVTVPSNGTNYTFTARACVSGSCSNNDGDSASAVAYGAVGSASARFADSGQTAVRFNWDPPPDNGRGPMQTRFNVDNGGWSGWAQGGGTTVVGNACNQGHSIQVQGRDSQGLEGPLSGTAGTSAPCPAPSISASKGSAYTGGNGGCTAAAPCFRMIFTTLNFSGSYTFSCQDVNGTFYTENHQRDVVSGGTYESDCYLGRGFGSPTITAIGKVTSNQVVPWL
jgi:hypothetical protein